MPEQTTSLAEIEVRDSQILRAASSDSDDWDDDTWAAWFRTAERVHGDGVSRTPLFDKVGAQQAQVAELTAQVEQARRIAVALEQENARLTAENAELAKALGLNEGAAA